jgi:hypothetical protein
MATSIPFENSSPEQSTKRNKENKEEEKEEIGGVEGEGAYLEKLLTSHMRSS